MCRGTREMGRGPPPSSVSHSLCGQAVWACSVVIDNMAGKRKARRTLVTHTPYSPDLTPTAGQTDKHLTTTRFAKCLQRFPAQTGVDFSFILSPESCPFGVKSPANNAEQCAPAAAANDCFIHVVRSLSRPPQEGLQSRSNPLHDRPECHGSARSRRTAAAVRVRHILPSHQGACVQ